MYKREIPEHYRIPSEDSVRPPSNAEEISHEFQAVAAAQGYRVRSDQEPRPDHTDASRVFLAGNGATGGRGVDIELSGNLVGTSAEETADNVLKSFSSGLALLEDEGITAEDVHFTVNANGIETHIATKPTDPTGIPTRRNIERLELASGDHLQLVVDEEFAPGAHQPSRPKRF